MENVVESVQCALERGEGGRAYSITDQEKPTLESAIVGRVPNASTRSYISGAVTLVSVRIAHRIISRLKQFPRLAVMLDHPPWVLVSNDRVVEQRGKISVIKPGGEPSLRSGTAVAFWCEEQ